MHTKRITAPHNWRAGKKTAYWITTPKSGKHSHRDSIPMTCILRDILRIADNSKEVKAILNKGAVKVDGALCRDHALGVGFMDVVTIETINKTLRAVPSRKGLRLLEVPKAQSHVKLLKVTGKHSIRSKEEKIQITFHDGTNMLIGKDEGKQYRRGDTVKYDVSKAHAIDIIQLKPGNVALVYDGAHQGEIARIVKVKRNVNGPDTVSLESKAGKKFDTLKEYLLAVGAETPEILLTEEEVR